MYEMQINAAITTQLLLSIFNIDGVVHYGIAGNANPSLHIGDVAIPHYWAHLGLWSWQVYYIGILFYIIYTEKYDTNLYFTQ